MSLECWSRIPDVGYRDIGRHGWVQRRAYCRRRNGLVWARPNLATMPNLGFGMHHAACRSHTDTSIDSGSAELVSLFLTLEISEV